MTVVFVTGTIGAGKSTLCNFFRELGADVISADQLVGDIYRDHPEIVEHVEQAIGVPIRHVDGSLNREALARNIFVIPKNMRKVENIVHPVVARLAREMISQSSAEVVVYEIPVLREDSSLVHPDFVILVDAPAEIRLQRLIARGLATEDAKQRIAAQASDERRFSDADIMIINDGSDADLATEAKIMYDRFLAFDRSDK